MVTPKRTAKAAAKRTTKPTIHSDDAKGITLRGLTPDDHAALERATTRRRNAIGGGFVSANSTILALLRAAMAREDASGAIETAPSRPETT